jgi:Zn-dependent peptidase ImmA (M78 family)/DNA-binding XRE family transcriptional regulator
MIRAVAAGFLGSKLRLARTFQGLTQVELGAEVGVTHTFIGQLEAGGKRPTPILLEALGDVLGFRPPFFAAPLDDEFRDEECHFRKRQTTPVSIKSRVLAHGTLFADLVAHLDTAVRFPAERLPEELRIGDRESVEAATAECRRLWGLEPDLPIPNLTRALERAGVVVTRFQGGAAKVDAFSRVGRRLIAVLNTDKGSASRSRFDLAHEAGHVVMHRGVDVGALELEEQADQFASALLMPRAGILREFPRAASLEWEALFALKQRWRVSLGALVRRAYDLRILDAARYQRAYKTMSARGWTRGEPHEFDEETPEVVALAFAELEKQRSVLPLDVARHLGWSPEVFERVSGIAAGAAGGEVVSLSTRRRIHFEGEQTAFDFVQDR